MSNTQTIKGYKVVLPTGKAKHGDITYEVGKEYVHDGPIKICNYGLHFCTKASHCFSYYSFDNKNRVFEVEGSGEMQTHDDDSKVCTGHLKIVKELTWLEVLQVCNEGANNTGLSNTGYRNTGDRNTGDRNTGGWNTGGWNTGGWNTGDRNTGGWNTGGWNTGGWNTGGWNTGDRNTGYSNTGDRNTGGFCTGNADFPMFNKKSNWTEQDFLNSPAYNLLSQVDTKMWVSQSYMTEGEKAANPSYKTAEGYLKDIPYKEAFQNSWHNWSEANRKHFTSLPNFNAKIFEEITGVKVKSK